MARKTPTAAKKTSTKKTAVAAVTAPPAPVAQVTAPALTAKTEAAVATATTTQAATNVPHELIARRAYELFCARGHVHGFETADWLQAERELRQAATRS